mgnify:CR=1 FL=1
MGNGIRRVDNDDGIGTSFILVQLDHTGVPSCLLSGDSGWHRRPVDNLLSPSCNPQHRLLLASSRAFCSIIRIGPPLLECKYRSGLPAKVFHRQRPLFFELGIGGNRTRAFVHTTLPVYDISQSASDLAASAA